MSSSHKVILYWFILFIIGFGLVFFKIHEYIAKKIFGLYLIIGVGISFRYKITIFKRGRFSDSIDSLDEIGIFANILVLILSLYLILPH